MATPSPVVYEFLFLNISLTFFSETSRWLLEWIVFGLSQSFPAVWISTCMSKLRSDTAATPEAEVVPCSGEAERKVWVQKVVPGLCTNKWLLLYSHQIWLLTSSLSHLTGDFQQTAIRIEVSSISEHIFACFVNRAWCPRGIHCCVASVT